MTKLGKRKSRRVRKVTSFTKRYGMTMREWCDYKKTHTPEEVQIIRDNV